jgi:hypothetical protein
MGQFDGIIGKQFFEKYRAVLDFKEGEMRLKGHVIPFLTTVPVRDRGQWEINNTKATEESAQLHTFFTQTQHSM